jgi:hypothetical protein
MVNSEDYSLILDDFLKIKNSSTLDDIKKNIENVKKELKRNSMKDIFNFTHGDILWFQDKNFKQYEKKITGRSFMKKEEEIETKEFISFKKTIGNIKEIIKNREVGTINDNTWNSLFPFFKVLFVSKELPNLLDVCYLVQKSNTTKDVSENIDIFKNTLNQGNNDFILNFKNGICESWFQKKNFKRYEIEKNWLHPKGGGETKEYISFKETIKKIKEIVNNGKIENITSYNWNSFFPFFESLFLKDPPNVNNSQNINYSNRLNVFIKKININKDRQSLIALKISYENKYLDFDGIFNAHKYLNTNVKELIIFLNGIGETKFELIKSEFENWLNSI